MPRPIGPDPDLLRPLPDRPRVLFVKNLTNLPNVEIGAYTYYDGPGGPQAFERNILYHYKRFGGSLRIGKFCSLAAQVKFMMRGSDHRMDGISTYPFTMYGGPWGKRLPDEWSYFKKGGTAVGNDVWIGFDALIMPGVTIGDGAIIGARSVVTQDVPAYAVVAGNPARTVRMRFDPPTIARLLEIRWWDWDIETITRAIPILSAGNLDQLESFLATQEAT